MTTQTHEPRKHGEPRLRGEQLIEEGIVVETAAGTPPRARVMMVAGEACSACAASFICKPEDADKRTLEAADPIGVKPGDRVVIAVTGGEVLKASFLVYGLPLLLLVIGVAGGMWLLPENLSGREPLAFLIGLLLVALGLFGVHRRERARRRAGLDPLPATILRKVEE